MPHALVRFATRWLVCSLGLWIATSFDASISLSKDLLSVVVAGLILAIVNTLIRPIIVIFSLPAIILTLGLFSIVINGVTVYLASLFYGPLKIANFWAAIFAGIVIGLVNYLVTTILGETKS